MRSKLLLVVSVVMVLSVVLAACQPAAPQAPAAAPIKKLMTAFGTGGDVPTLDPSLSEDTSSTQIVEETSIGLTRLNEITTATEPGLATKWDVSADGLVYTFHLRTDVPWVKYDAIKKAVVKVQTCDAKDRMVTADDFYYGMMRTLDPKTGSPYAFALTFVVKGAQEYNAPPKAEEGKPAPAPVDPKTVGIKVVDPATIEITFLKPAAYNAAIVGNWMAHAEPKWLIEGDDCTQARKDRWIETGFFQSYGPFTLKEWVHDSYITMIKNPFWPADVAAVPQPKLDEVTWQLYDVGPAFAEYEAGNIDKTDVPLADIDRIKADAKLSKEYKTSPELCTYYYGFNTMAPVVDDVRVRLALSMAIDRKSLIANVTKGDQEPAQWFSRPGIAGSPTIDKYPDLGVKYNPEKAKELLDAYLKEKSTTADKLDLTLMYNTSANHQKVAEAIQQMWKEKLGVNVKVTNQEWKVYLVTTKDPKITPQIFRLGWCLDYPDANNWVKDQAAVGGNQNPKGPGGGGFNWKNDQFEKLVSDAVTEMDAAKRVDLYAQAEKILVADDAVLAPIYWYTRVQVTKPYVTRTYSVLGGKEYYEKWDINKK